MDLKLDAASWLSLSRLLDQALDLPREERAAWLAALAPADAALRPLLAGLLDAHDRSGHDRFLEALPTAEIGDPPPGEMTGPERGPGAEVGPYRLERELGRGGMGSVWLAQRSDGTLRRPVALKLPHPGVWGPQFLERFSRERDILAGLSHPNIARLYDAGVAKDGQPFLALEFVDGVPLGDYCDRHRLSSARRVGLFLQVLDAVHHAHRSLVIHRDLKPGNILVAEDGQVRLLDFGIAKLLGSEGGEARPTALTELGGRALTLDFASPEQIRGLPLTTASDVYSCGVILYELLCGHPPYRLKRGTRAEMEEAILDTDPVPPSRAGIGAEDATARGVTPRRLARILRSDLDAIVLKALRKDPQDRYRSAEALARDLEHCLRGEPVLARSPTFAYRLSRFVSRHKAGVAAGSAAFVLLVATAVTTTVQARRIALERDRANRQAQRAGAALDFLTDIFRLSDPEQARGEAITAREILDRGASEIERGLGDAPDVQAEMMLAIGRNYKNLGLAERAEPLVRRSLDLRTAAFGAGNAQTQDAAIELADVLRRRESLEEAEALARRLLASIEGAGGPEEQAGAASTVLGNTLIDLGRNGDAEPYLRRAIESWTRTAGPEDRRTLQAATLLGYCISFQGRYDEADAVLRDVLDKQRRRYGNDHPSTIAMLNSLAENHRGADRNTEAEGLLREAVVLSRKVLGDDHPETLMVINNLGSHLSRMGRFAEAEPLVREALEGDRRVFGPGNSVTLVALTEFGALVQRDPKRLGEAEAAFRETLEGMRQIFGEENPLTARAYNNLAQVIRDQGRLGEAEDLFRTSLESARRAFGPEHPTTLTILGSLGELLVMRGRPGEALEPLTTVLAASRRVLPEKHLSIGVALRKYGACLAALRRYPEAEEALLEGREIIVASVGAAHHQAQRAARGLVALYEAWGKADQAARWKAKLASGS